MKRFNIKNSIFIAKDRLPNLDNIPYDWLNSNLIYYYFVEKNRANYENRRVIFCINSGRVGSGFLSAALSQLAVVKSKHEPMPRMTGKYLDMSKPGHMEKTQIHRRAKLLGTILELKNEEVDIPYIETSHMFIKTYFDIVTNYFKNIEVIVLRRDLGSVVKSFVELGFFSDRLKQWRLWMHEPLEELLYFTPPMQYKNMDVVDKIITYLLDIEKRTEIYCQNYPHVKIHEVYLSNLTDVKGMTQLIENLGLRKKTGTINELINNTRNETKKLLGIESKEKKYYQNRIKSYIEMCKDKGIPVPNANKIKI